MSFDGAIALTLHLLGFSILIQTLEMLSIRRAYIPGGIFEFKNIQSSFEVFSKPIQNILRIVLQPPGFTFLLVGQTAAAFWICWTGSLNPGALGYLVFSVLLVNLRWRGTFNGGSDYMTLAVLFPLSIASLAPDAPWIAQSALAYSAVQLTLSYFIAGVIKVRTPEWRSGRALKLFANASNYALSDWAKTFINSRACYPITLGILLFECLFPLAFLSQTMCWIFLTIGLCFHIGNALVFGLNRFLWAWCAAYPALLYWVSRI